MKATNRQCILRACVELPIATKVRVIATLNFSLATIADLKAQIKSASWNVTDSSCIGLQEVFTQIADQLEEYIDIFALRITHLGGLPSVTVRAVAKLSLLPDYPYGIVDDSEHITAVSLRLKLCTQLLLEKALQTSQWGDWATSELYTEVMQVLEQHSRSLQAYLQR